MTYLDMLFVIAKDSNVIESVKFRRKKEILEERSVKRAKARREREIMRQKLRDIKIIKRKNPDKIVMTKEERLQMQKEEDEAQKEQDRLQEESDQNNVSLKNFDESQKNEIERENSEEREDRSEEITLENEEKKKQDSILQKNNNSDSSNDDDNTDDKLEFKDFTIEELPDVKHIKTLDDLTSIWRILFNVLSENPKFSIKMFEWEIERKEFSQEFDINIGLPPVFFTKECFDSMIEADALDFLQQLILKNLSLLITDYGKQRRFVILKQHLASVSHNFTNIYFYILCDATT